MTMDEKGYRDYVRGSVVVACMPAGSFDPRRIWWRRFIGVKAGDNPDGTIKVQVYGPAEDLRQAVFRKTFTIALCLLATAAHAQELPTSHKVGLSVYAASATLDYHSTYQAMSQGIRESNPLGRLTEGQPAATVAVGASVDVAITYLLYKWLGKRHPNLTTALLIGASSVRVSLAAGNYQAANIQRRLNER